MGKHGNRDRLYFGGSKITADGDDSREIKRHLLLGRKVMTNLNPLQYSAWKIPLTGEPGRLQSMGLQRVGHDWATSFTFTFLHWRRKWQPTPVFLPGESQGWQSLVGFAISGVAQGQTRLKRLGSSSSSSSRLVITFLLRSKHLLISWLQSPSALILLPPRNKVSHCFHCFLIYLPWSDGTGCHNLSFLNVEL